MINFEKMLAHFVVKHGLTQEEIIVLPALFERVSYKMGLPKMYFTEHAVYHDKKLSDTMADYARKISKNEDVRDLYVSKFGKVEANV